MVIVDTSVWINHFRRADFGLIALLESGLVLAHPFVIGELACGTLRQRAEILDGLRDLPAATIAQDNEVLAMIEREALWGRGIGWVDVHLVAAARLGADHVWSTDKQLNHVCRALALEYQPQGA